MIDTLRADRLGCYGNRRGLTPFLDELARRGVVFANAYAASSWTSPSVASLFTSRYPSQHRVAAFDSSLRDEEVTLAEKLVPLRYRAGGFLANWRLTRDLGYAQGFRSWYSYVTHGKFPAGPLTRRSLRWLDGSWARRVVSRWWPRPVLLYVHYMEPHSPYVPPAAYRQRFERDGKGETAAEAANRKLLSLRWNELSREEVSLLGSLYDASVAYLDAQLRRLFRGLDERGVLHRAIVIVTADHGEEFNEHGLMSHGSSLYNPAIRVPLILLAPGVAGGAVVEQNVSLVDVAPTVLQLLHLPAEPRFEGRSLLPLLRGGEGEPVPVIAELPRTGSAYDVGRHSVAVIREKTKLLLARDGTGAATRIEAYDLARDPEESVPDAPSALAESRALVAVAREREARLGEEAALAEHRPVDDATRRRLRALGYLY